METHTHTDPDYGLCSCGQPAQRYWRGSAICWSCWHWNKLGINEAKFWVRGIGMLTENEFGSGPDINDAMQWDRWGVKDEVFAAIETLNSLQDRYIKEAEAHGLDLLEWLRKKFAEVEVKG